MHKNYSRNSINKLLSHAEDTNVEKIWLETFQTKRKNWTELHHPLTVYFSTSYFITSKNMESKTKIFHLISSQICRNLLKCLFILLKKLPSSTTYGCEQNKFIFIRTVEHYDKPRQKYIEEYSDREINILIILRFISDITMERKN